jgi:molybdate transport system substrate-binding protein
MNAAKERLTLFALAFALSLPAAAAEVNVMISGGFSAAYEKLVPEFERATGHRVRTVRGASMGATPDAIPNRLDRAEPADVLVMVGEALESLEKRGKVLPGSRVELARGLVGMAVRAGAAKPDISTAEAFRRSLLAAKSIAYSDSASGVYLETVLFPRMGLAEALKGKARMIPGEPVARVVARGEAELGFQQVSELLPVPGIDFVGPIPAELQKVTPFAAGIAAGAKEPEAGKALIRFLASKESAATIGATGLEPAAAR